MNSMKLINCTNFMKLREIFHEPFGISWSSMKHVTEFHRASCNVSPILRNSTICGIPIVHETFHGIP